MCDRIGKKRAAGLRRLVTIAGLIALPAPLAAQYAPPPPPQDVPRASSSDTDRAPAAATQAGLLRGAACQVGREAASVESLLATAPYSAQERTEAVRMVRLIQRCLRSRDAISTSPALLRGAIAETLYESRFAAGQAARTPAQPAQSLFRSEQTNSRTDAATLAPAFALAECTASGHGELVRGLLATEPGSAEAEAAFRALNPAFVSCVSGDTRLSVDGRTLRGMLAEALYRWSVVQRDGSGSPWAAPAAQGN